MPEDNMIYSVPLLAILSDGERKVKFIHEEAQKFLPRPIKEYIGADLDSIITEIAAEPFDACINASGKDLVFPFDGEYYNLSVQEALFGDGKKGTIVLLQANGVVNGRIACRFATVLNCGICILHYTEELTVISANEACYRLYGYTPEQFERERQNSPVRLLNEEDRQAARQILRENLDAGNRYTSFEMRITRRDGSVLWVENRCTLLHYENRDRLVVLTWDITAKKNLEREVALNVQRYKIALSKSSNVIWEYHLDEDVAYIENTTGSPFHGRRVVRNFSKQTFKDGFIDPEYLPAFQQMLSDLQDGKTLSSVLLCGIGKDGEKAWYRITHTVLNDGDKPGRIAIGVAENVSGEQKEKEKYQNEEQYRRALVGDALASYEIDLDEDLIVESVLENNADMLASVGLTINCPYSEFLKCWADQKVHPEDRWIFLQELNPESLRKQFEKGHQEVICEYRSVIANEDLVWCNTTIYLITAGNHLRGFVYVKNIEEKKRRELEILKKSQTDPLTGILNRGAAIQKINQILAEKGETDSALFIIDADNFKAVNDTYGHIYGDRVLADIAYKLVGAFEDNAVVGRLGGDEFLVFLPDIPDDSYACAKAAIIARELQLTHKGQKGSMEISNSIGIAFCPRHGNTFYELYVKADAALRHAKQSGKSCYSVFDSQISETVPLEYVNREWLIDELEEVVYISDIRDYTLLYLNRVGRVMAGVGLEDFGKSKCYRALQGRDTPCPFCTNAKLSKEKFYVWEFENSYLNKNFIVKDKLVDWNQKQVRMEIALDLGERVSAQIDVTSKYYMETAILESLRALNGAEKLEEAIRRTLKIILDFYGAERTYIMEIDRERGFASNTYECCKEGIPPQKVYLQKVALENIPYVLETFNHKHHVIIPETSELKQSYPSEYRYLTSRNTHSLLAVPFEDRESFNGYIGVDNPVVNQDAISFLESIVYNIASEIKKRRLYEQLEYEASYDSQSGLLNRSSYVRYLEEMRRSKGSACGVVTADINGLKQLNRDYGHDKGDETIIGVADVMRRCFPESKIFRMSGDEFVIVALGISYDEFMGRVNEMTREMGLRTPDGVSMGSTWTEELSDCDLLLRHAEERMIVNKQLYYKNSDDMRKHYVPEVVKNLTKEVDEGYYRTYLQPQYNPYTGEIRSAEALARYQVPGEGTRPPGGFIPLLEKMKLVRHLDFYMLEEVCRLLQRWKKEGKKLLPISVNFSRITLLESDLFQVISDIQRRYDVPYHLITIEITETIGDIEHKVVAAIGSQLREAGFRLSLDDFGADYANMSLLSIMHFDEVKLDKSLIDNLAKNDVNRTVVKSIVDLCHNLNVECVAEGVETQSQLELLKSYGCTIIQGYYFSEPLVEKEFEERLAEEQTGGITC